MKVEELREQIQNLYWSRTQRERLILVAALGAVILLVVWMFLSGVYSFYKSQKSHVTEVKESYLPTLENIERYKSLKAKLETVLEENLKSQLDVAEASGAIDQVVKSSIGDKKYRFTKDENLVDINIQGSKRAGITLEFQEVSLDEIVKLLYNFDSSDKPIFLGNVEIFKNRSASNLFKLKLEVFTIQKVG